MRMQSALAVLLIATTAHAGEVKASREKRFDRDVLVLDNGLVRIAVTPEIGGRVLEFVQVNTKNNAAKVRPDSIHRKPTDAWVGADYGGFSDVPTAGWPGAMWGVTYEASFQPGAVPGSQSVLVKGEADGTRVERTMTLTPDSTALDVHVRQTNLKTVEQKMLVRIHCEMGAGELPDENDSIYWQSPKGPRSLRYIYGAEYKRFEWMDVADGWVAGIDAASASGFVRLFEPANEPQRVFYWCGYNEDPEHFGVSGAFFALDRFGKEQVVAAGATIEQRERMFLISGVRRADFVSEGALGAFELDRTRYGSADTVTATVTLVGAEAIGKHEATMRLMQDARELLIRSVTIPGASAGKASVSTVDLPLPELPDGSFSVHLSVTSEDGKAIGSAMRTFEVSQDLVNRARGAVQAYADQANKFAAVVKERTDKPLWIDAELRVANLRREQLQLLLEQSEYESAIAAASRATTEIDACLVRLSK